VYLGLLYDSRSSTSYLSPSNQEHARTCQQLMHAFATVADAVLGPGWSCTSIRIQRHCQFVGYIKGRTRSDQRSYQFAWVDGAAVFADCAQPVGPMEHADLWCEGSNGPVAIGLAPNFVCV
jgi:hypothetical protein